MGLLRNREWTRLLLICLGLTGLLSLLGFSLGPRFFLFALGVCGAVSAAALILYALHLRRISSLTAYVERVLRGEMPLRLSENREGEYAIFENELYKLSSALYSQLDAARQEKETLARALADISHQIKTPLTAMGIECQLLRADQVDDGERKRLARHLDEQLRRMGALIGMLLKMSRMDAGVVPFHPAETKVDDLLDLALSPLLIPLELRQIRLERLGGTEDKCTVDVSWTAEAVGNIIKNCMEHTPAGGVITIAHQETPLLTRLTIQNSGPPISDKDLPHIFERFYRGENAAEGSAGIGLSFARQVIARQQGALTAENTDQGPRFSVLLYKRTV